MHDKWFYSEKESKHNLLNSKKAGVFSFLITKGWMIALVIISLILLFVIGAMNPFLYQNDLCELGDGFECNNIIIELNKQSSNGATIELGIINRFDQDINNISIIAKACGKHSFSKSSIDCGENISYTINNCRGPVKDKSFKSKLDIHYSLGNTEFYNKGYIQAMPGTTNFDQNKKTIGEKIDLWIKKNIG